MRARLSYANVMATVAAFLALGGGAYAALSLPANSVTSREIARNAVKAKQIKKRAVRKKELKRDAVRTRKIKDGRVLTVDLADAAVNGAKLADAAVSTPKLADGSVTPPKLGDVSFAGVDAEGSTSSGSAGPISPAGPELRVTIGQNAFATVLVQARITAPGGATAEDCRFGVLLDGPSFDVQLPFQAQATFSGPSPGPRTEYGFTVPPLPGGELRFEMVYWRASGDEPCTFSDRRLWVEASEP